MMKGMKCGCWSMGWISGSLACIVGVLFLVAGFTGGMLWGYDREFYFMLSVLLALISLKAGMCRHGGCACACDSCKDCSVASGKDCACDCTSCKDCSVKPS